MSNLRRGIATSVEISHNAAEAFLEMDRAIEMLRSAVRSFCKKPSAGVETSRSKPKLIASGTVLLTDDGHGVGRAVAADLKALGYSVLRVRHGLGEGPIEGVNLRSAAAVAALIERARGHGHLAAIVHAAPLGGDARCHHSWDEPDDARTLALLAQAAADDLIASAGRGGSCLIVARQYSDLDDGAKLGRWVEISARSLKDVRVRSLNFPQGRECEVVAAEVVRAVLGTDEPPPIAGQIGSPRVRSRALLIGAPDRASWLHLASALVDWLEDSSGVNLDDLAFTLHHQQPSYPFRVGLVAETESDLRSRLIRTISRLAEPDCGFVNDLSGAYWFGDGKKSPSASSKIAGPSRLRDVRPRPRAIEQTVTIESLLKRTGRQWWVHQIAAEFARTGRLDLIRNEPGELLDLSSPLTTRESPTDEAPRHDSRGVAESLDALDSAIELRRELLSALCEFSPVISG